MATMRPEPSSLIWTSIDHSDIEHHEEEMRQAKHSIYSSRLATFDEVRTQLRQLNAGPRISASLKALADYSTIEALYDLKLSACPDTLNAGPVLCTLSLCNLLEEALKLCCRNLKHHAGLLQREYAEGGPKTRCYPSRPTCQSA